MIFPNPGYVACDAIGASVEDPEKILSKNLKLFLEEMGLNQVDLASRMGKSESYVSRILSGESWVSGKVLKAIATALGTSYRNLLNEEKPDIKPPPAKHTVTLAEALRVINASNEPLSFKRRSKKKPE